MRLSLRRCPGSDRFWSGRRGGKDASLPGGWRSPPGSRAAGWSVGRGYAAIRDHRPRSAFLPVVPSFAGRPVDPGLELVVKLSIIITSKFFNAAAIFGIVAALNGSTWIEPPWPCVGSVMLVSVPRPGVWPGV